jgi:hypothetical protein
MWSAGKAVAPDSQEHAETRVEQVTASRGYHGAGSASSPSEVSRFIFPLCQQRTLPTASPTLAHPYKYEPIQGMPHLPSGVSLMLFGVARGMLYA